MSAEGRAPQAPPTILVFLAADLASFLLFFFVFMVERSGQLDAFNQSAATLNVGIGLANTLILLSSGCLVAIAANACLENDRDRARKFILASVLLALGFVALKVLEYSAKYDAGIGLATNSFYSFYFIVTGLHLFHVIAGITVLTFVYRWILSEPDVGVLTAKVTTGALYWHLVDLLWILIFPLFYLQGN